MAEKQRRVVALGFFDGLHRGHKAVIDRAAELAQTLEATLSIVTFDRRPKNAVRGESAELLTDRAAKAELVRCLFPEAELIELIFDEALRQTPWQTFANEILQAKLGAVAAVCGENFRFGARGEGTPALLRSVLPTEIVGELTADGQVISSTRIRLLIESGEIACANRLLGHPHTIVGPVVHGDGRGATLGFATLNIALAPDLIRPRPGVYASRLTLRGQTYQAITNFGTRPTFYENGVYDCETHVFGLQGDCYGEKAILSLAAFLRPERKFATREALIEQIRTDVEAAKRCLNSNDERGEEL